MDKQLDEVRLDLALEAGRRYARQAPALQETLERLGRGGSALADTPARNAAFAGRTLLGNVARGDVGAVLVGAGALDTPLWTERMIGPKLDWDYFPPNPLAQRAGVPVARIVTMPGGPDEEPQGFGSGFLVGEGLLLTNHHVLPSHRQALGVGANFRYERVQANRGPRRGEVFELDPDTLFVSDRGLDYALVALRPRAMSGAALDELGFLPLIAQVGKVLVGHPIHIIQHPNGEEKRYSVSENQLVLVGEDGFMHYRTDTLPGSSGSPAFNDAYEVVALHHSGVPAMRGDVILDKKDQPWNRATQTDDDIQWVANEGVRISFIVQHLLGRAQAGGDLGALQAERVRRALNAPGETRVEVVNPATEASFPGAGNTGGHQGGISFSLSGPTTIHVYGGAAPTPAGLPAPTDSTPALVEKALRFDPRYDTRPGYQPEFLPGVRVPLPTVVERAGELLPGPDGQPLVLPYHHFSLVMNGPRRLQMWSAVNVDYSEPVRHGRPGRASLGRDRWIEDRRIAAKFQIVDREIYAGTQFDRGHMVRRDDNAWGETFQELEFANADTFHYTNCTPQHLAFNQSSQGGLWGELEERIVRALAAAGNRACLLAGPVLAPDDPQRDFDFGPVQYPLKFWKIVAVAELTPPGTPKKGARKAASSQLRTYGFVLDQARAIAERGLHEGLDLRGFELHQVSLKEIEDVSGVTFGAALHAADVKGGAALHEARAARVPLESFADVQLR